MKINLKKHFENLAKWIFSLMLVFLIATQALAEETSKSRYIYNLSSDKKTQIYVDVSVAPFEYKDQRTTRQLTRVSVQVTLRDHRLNSDSVIGQLSYGDLESLTLPPNPDEIEGAVPKEITFDATNLFHRMLVRKGYFMLRTQNDSASYYRPETKVYLTKKIIETKFPYASVSLPDIADQLSSVLNKNTSRSIEVVEHDVYGGTNYHISVTDSKESGRFKRTVFRYQGQGQPLATLETQVGKTLPQEIDKPLTAAEIQNNHVYGIEAVRSQGVSLKIADDAENEVISTNDLNFNLQTESLHTNQNTDLKIVVNKLNGNVSVYSKASNKLLGTYNSRADQPTKINLGKKTAELIYFDENVRLVVDPLSNLRTFKMHYGLESSEAILCSKVLK